MTDGERDGITVMIATLNGTLWYFVACWLFGASNRVGLVVCVVTTLMCWVLLRWFQIRGDDNATR